MCHACMCVCVCVLRGVRNAALKKIFLILVKKESLNYIPDQLTFTCIGPTG